MPLNIGNRIKQLRGEKTQPAFAAELGISFRSYRYYESGTRVPPGPVLTKLAEIGGVTVDWILTGEKPAGNRVAELEEHYGLDTDRGKINRLLDDMDEEATRDVLKYAEKEKLLTQCRREKKLKEG